MKSKTLEEVENELVEVRAHKQKLFERGLYGSREHLASIKKIDKLLIERRDILNGIEND